MVDVTKHAYVCDDTWVRLKVASAEAEGLTGTPTPGYAVLYRAVLDGKIASRRIGREVELYLPSLRAFLGGEQE